MENENLHTYFICIAYLEIYSSFLMILNKYKIVITMPAPFSVYSKLEANKTFAPNIRKTYHILLVLVRNNPITLLHVGKTKPNRRKLLAIYLFYVYLRY